MNFTATYRASDGSLRTEVLSAASRAEAYAQLKSRNINAVSLVEGGSAKPASGGSAASPGRPLVRAGVATGLLAACAVGVFLLWPGEERPEARQTPKAQSKPKPQKVARPVRHREPVATNAPTEKVATPAPERPWKVGETRDGYILLPSGRRHKVLGVTTNFTSSAEKPKYAIFHHHVENEIASLLTMRPGEGIVGTPRYSPKLNEEFLKSLENPIIVYDEDSEEDKALKNAMVETKAQLKERLENGEDLAQILLDTRREYQELARYRMTIEAELVKFKRRENVTEQDLDDFINAANATLAKKGIAPMKLGAITRQKLKMRDAKTQSK